LNALNLISLISTALLVLSPMAWADDDDVQDVATVTLNSALYGRTSVNFKDKTNITNTVPAGSKAQVLEVRQLKTGSYGVRVKVTTLGKVPPTSIAGPIPAPPTVGTETWLYYSQKDPGLDFEDKSGEDIDDPEESLVQRAGADTARLGPMEGTVAKPSLPTQQKVLMNSKPANDNNIVIPASGVDPNLAKTSTMGATEGGFGMLCMNGHCLETEEHNRTDLSNVAKDIQPGAKKPTPQPVVKVPKDLPTRPSNDPNNKWANDPVVSRYSNSATTKKMISSALANRKSHSTKKCYRYVKRALVAAGAVTSYPPGVNAKQGVRDLISQNDSLRRAGKPTWVNMLDDPKYRSMIKNPGDAPKGAVLIFRNGRPEPGDAAIKTDNGPNGGFVNDFYSTRPVTQSPKGTRYQKMGVGYELIGVMITE
jgi:hypothetical protein